MTMHGASAHVDPTDRSDRKNFKDAAGYPIFSLTKRIVGPSAASGRR